MAISIEGVSCQASGTVTQPEDKQPESAEKDDS